jgi:hypothetical protein
VGYALTFMVQFGGERFHPGRVSLMDPLILIAIVAGLGAIALPLLTIIVKRTQTVVRGRRAERRRLRSAAGAERRARAMMSELCPHGWKAHITIYDGPEWQVDEGLEHGRVSLEWAELEPGTGRPLVMRQVSAPSVADALDAMLAGRRTDETLEQIEQGAASDGALWPDL